MRPILTIIFCLLYSVLSTSNASANEQIALDNKTHQNNSVVFIAGQSREEFSDYLESVCESGKSCGLPAGAAIYTSLDGNGLTRPHANMPGDNHQDLWYLLNVYQPLSPQVALWLASHELESIGEGHFEAKIARFIQTLEETNRTVFLRIGYEFDGPHNRFEPEAFVRAYRVIAKQARRAKNIQLIWHSFAMHPTYQERDVMQWYPGDRYVDWIGVSYFQVDERGFHKGPNRQRLIDIAEQKGLPVMITEASAIRYTSEQADLTGQAYWDYWYKPFFEFIESNPSIKAVSMINVDWDSQAQHAVLDWGDARIAADPVVLSNWRATMQKPYWFFSQEKQDDYFKRLIQ